MKKVACVIYFILSSILSDAQGLHLGYLFKRAVVSDSSFDQIDDTTYQGSHFKLILGYNSNKSLWLYALLTRKNNRYNYYKLKNYFIFEYDGLSRLISNMPDTQYGKPYYYYYRDSSNFFSGVSSREFGFLDFNYANGLIQDVEYHDCELHFDYDAYQNITTVSDPCSIANTVRSWLYKTNDYLSMAKDFAGTKGWTLQRIDQYTYRKRQTGTALTFTDGNSSRTIYTNSSIPLNAASYPSCPDCDIVKQYFPIRASLGISLDARGAPKEGHNYVSTASPNVRFFINNSCYTKILLGNYIDAYGSGRFFIDTPYVFRLNSFTPVFLNNGQRLYLFQTSQYTWGLTTNLVKISAHKKYFEANMGLQADYSKIYLPRLNRSLPYNMHAFYTELMFEMVRSNNLKLDFSAQYFIQNDVHRQDIGYYKDKYVIPSLEMKFLKGDLGRVKIGCVKQITSSVPPYFIAQIEYRPSSILDYIESSGYAMERRKLRIKRREKRREERLERRYLRKHKIQSE
jgi:hypothetical protein